MTKILVDVDERLLAKAAARLGTKTKKATVGKALEIAARDNLEAEEMSRSWDTWADSLGDRLTEVDWDRAWS